MPMPSAVKVGAATYRVVPYSLDAAHDSGRSGECRVERRELAVGDWLPEPVRAEVLTHEIGHAIFDQWGIADGAGEEDVVAAFTKGLLAVWRDNPGLVEWTGRVLAGQEPERIPEAVFTAANGVTVRGPGALLAASLEQAAAAQRSAPPRPARRVPRPAAEATGVEPAEAAWNGAE